jgi:hypothetical protein
MDLFCLVLTRIMWDFIRLCEWVIKKIFGRTWLAEFGFVLYAHVVCIIKTLFVLNASVGAGIGGINGLYSGLKETKAAELTGAIRRTQ